MMPFIAYKVVKWYFDEQKIIKASRNASAKSLVHAGFIVRKSSKESMHNAPRLGTPSKAGDPPNIQTGHLRRSLIVQPLSFNTVLVGSNMSYASIHELGIYHGHPVPKRAYLLPALKREYQRLPSYYRTEFHASVYQ